MEAPATHGRQGALATRPDGPTRSPRRRVDLPVEEFLSGQHLTQRCTEIGPDWLFLTGSAAPHLGRVLTRRFVLPDGGAAIWVRGEVVHCSDDPARPGVGIRFVEVQEDDRARIARFVAEGDGGAPGR
jgi:hypothetical protein